MKIIGRNINTNDEATNSSVAINSATATLLIAANTVRIGLIITNPNNQACWIRFYAAATDNIKQGIYLTPGEKYCMTPDNIYTGEISALMVSGAAKSIYFIEY